MLQSSKKQSTSTDYDIVSAYHALRQSDASLTKPVVAIHVLIEVLGAKKSTTVFETIELVKKYSDLLVGSVDNWIPLAVGTDMFQHHLIQWLKSEQDWAGGGPSGTTDKMPAARYRSFDDVRRHLLRNTRVLVREALDARYKVAAHGWQYLGENDTILTYGASRAVIGTMIRAATESRKRNTPEWAIDTDKLESLPFCADFKVVYVRDHARPVECDAVVGELRSHGIRVAETSFAAIDWAFRCGHITSVLLGAEAVMHDGGILSRMGTAQIAYLAHERGRIPVRVAAETHKFTRLAVPIVKSRVTDVSIDFEKQWNGTDSLHATASASSDAVDYTPSDHIKAIITEEGVKLPGDVSRRMLRLFGSLGI